MRVVAASDWVIDMGPGAGEGRQIVASGTPEEIREIRRAKRRTICAPAPRKSLIRRPPHSTHAAGNTGTRCGTCCPMGATDACGALRYRAPVAYRACECRFTARGCHGQEFQVCTRIDAGVRMRGSGTRASESYPHEIYEAVRAGHLDQAEQMMKLVLKEHPRVAKPTTWPRSSMRAKAIKRGAPELATAETLAPGLPFAKPDSVAASATAALGGGRVPSLSAAIPRSIPRFRGE